MSSQIDVDRSPSGAGCLECEQSDSWWLHLRRCAACGHVGCCDSSLNRHASSHAAATGHRFIQTFEPGEDWWWDFSAGRAVHGPPLAEPTSHPASQAVPGPAERLPTDWRARLARARTEP